MVEAVEKAHRTVVSISSEKKASSHSRWPFSPEENQLPLVSGMGSGVLIDGRGYILTNYHVVDHVQGVVVQLSDGATYPARVLQFDAVMDLAIIKIDPDRSLPAIKIGTSSDLMVGETVITIGNAYGYENTVSVGIVSASAPGCHALGRPDLSKLDSNRRVHQPRKLRRAAHQRRR